MKEIIWKFGEKPEKSFKKVIENEIDNISKKDIIKEIENNLEFEIINKRESVDAKLNERQLIGQRNSNPYFSKSSYIDDLKTHNDFLIPKNSNVNINFNYK
jgi:hypothetical protein